MPGDVDHDSCPCCAGGLGELPPWALTTWACYCPECAWIVHPERHVAKDCPTHGEPTQTGTDEPPMSDSQ
jgi:hypothetical protein